MYRLGLVTLRCPMARCEAVKLDGKRCTKDATERRGTHAVCGVHKSVKGRLSFKAAAKSPAKKSKSKSPQRKSPRKAAPVYRFGFPAPDRKKSLADILLERR